MPPRNPGLANCIRSSGVLGLCQEGSDLSTNSQVHSIRQDLMDQPFPDVEAAWYTDGSSLIQDGCRPWIPNTSTIPGVYPGRPKMDKADPTGPLPREVQWMAQRADWERLTALYSSGPVPEPHAFWPGDWVYVKRHQQETLEPLWKGPYIMVLVTPTTLKDDGITSWIHHTHVRLTDLFAIKEDSTPHWRLQRDPDNPLKLKLQKRQDP
ncbi:uncharacterized protein LOC128572691 [Nycticebus coucang]|uniref:uncharacterized protein LOC128572691 n=1 Tax=Nycticebus coucang TaxID=9470 RepID=UPI00234D6F9F|nr:uncharacterized protein LOC128572691 [Nycticebus coucang]